MNSIRGPRPVLGINLSALVFVGLILSVALIRGNEAGWKRDRGDDDGSEQKVSLPRVLDFKEYVIKFNKAYGTTEWMAKANLFLARVINIFRHNAKFLQQKYGYFLGLNAFTDISARDFEAMGSRDDPALAAVQELQSYPPNMPASELPSVQQLTGSEGFSMSASEDDDELSTAAYEARYGAKRSTKRTLVDFSKDESEKLDNSNLLKEFYREFRKSVKPEEAERVSKVIDLDNRLETAGSAERLLRKSDPKSERAMIRRKIKYTPVVDSNNANYDGLHVVSHGVYDNMQAGRAFSDKMSAFLNYDVDILDDLRPYEPPSKRTRTKDEGEDEDGGGSKSSYFSSFFSTAKELAKSVASTFTIDGMFDADELEEDEKLEEKVKQQNEASAKRIKYTVDWRVTGCITRPKSQNGCNACYAFTVVSLMEYYYCRQTRELTEFSAQYIVDCGKRAQLNGCRGGQLGFVGKFISLHGLELQAIYPYSGTDGQCPYAPSESKKMGYLRPKILNWVYVKKMSDWYEQVRRGPLLVGIAMPPDFLAYGGGIHDGIDCNPDKVHAMLLIGSGSQDGKEFWLLKNSFSSDWGENGYFRLAKDAPLKCFNSGVVVRVDFKQGETRNPEHRKPVLAAAI